MKLPNMRGSEERGEVERGKLQSAPGHTL